MSKRNSNRKCAKCGTTRHVESHHVFAKCHYGQGMRVNLCTAHHRLLEYQYIQPMEGQLNGRRVKKMRQFYIDALVNFLTDDC